jgi:hypothetical protein
VDNPARLFGRRRLVVGHGFGHARRFSNPAEIVTTRRTSMPGQPPAQMIADLLWMKDFTVARGRVSSRSETGRLSQPAEAAKPARRLERSSGDRQTCNLTRRGAV